MEFDTPDVVVVGGGIIGSCIAYYLAREGRDVVVMDPAPGEGASCGNAGILCPSYSLPMANPDSLRAGMNVLTGRGPVTFRRPVPAWTLLWMTRFALACRPGRAWREAASLHELTTRSVHLYDEMIADGLDLELRPHGWTYVFHDEDEYRAHVRFAQRLGDAGVRHELLDRGALAAREPNVARDVAGAVVYPDDRNMDPGRTTRIVAEAAEKHGARFVKERLVGVERHGGRIRKVWSDHRELQAGVFVIAAGAASRSVGRRFGVSLPVEAGHGVSLTLPAPNQQLVTGALMAGDAHVVISPGSDYVRITSGMEFGAHDAPGPLPSAIARMRRHAEMTVPGLRDLPRDGVAWRGARPMTPTGVPIMRPIADNLIAAVGHNTQGMTLGPIAGRTVAEHVDGVLGSHRAKPTTLRGEPAVPSVHAYTPDGEPAPLAPYNTVCTYGDLVFLGGHLPLGPDGELLSHLSPSDQTTNAMEHLRVSLRSAGSDFDYLLKVTIYATSLDDFAEINKAYAEFFTGHLPARATIQAGRLIGGVALEIEAIAARRTD